MESRFITKMASLKLPRDAHIAVACSGGPDSMALALLAQRFFTKPLALIVDHGLRAESAEEAEKTGKRLEKLGIPYEILEWKGTKPARNIQEAARKARYRLLTDYCKEHAVSHLLVAHHREDQAETFLLRLARGSGVDGLAAMSAVSSMHGVTLVRPLLDCSRAELLSYLKTRRQPFIRDPSNENPVFDRVKMRKLLPALTEAGLTPERLAKTAAQMARTRAYLERQTERFLKSACTLFPEGYARLTSLDSEEEIALRALAKLIMTIGGNDVRPRFSDLTRLHTALRSTGFKGATLGGCVFTRHNGAFLIYREQQAVASSIALKPGMPTLWDNRFEMALHSNAKGLRVGALTQQGWLKLTKTQKIKNPCPTKNILYSLPALRDGKGSILAVPQLEFFEGVKCNACFKAVETTG